MLAGLGNDLIAIGDTNFNLIHGGTGIDVLTLSDSFVIDGALNFSAISDFNLLDIEQIDLTGAGQNVLTLTESDVLSMTDINNALSVGGDDTGNTDSVVLTGFSTGGTLVLDGFTYQEYTSGSATVYVETQLTVVL